MDKTPDSLLWELTGGNKDNVNGKIVFDALKQGDAAAKRVVNAYVGYLATGIANAINVFRPEAVVLGGGICNAGEAFIKPLTRRVNREIYGGTKFAPVDIVVASLGNDAGIVGAAALAFGK